jgi:hypothetical protein
MINVSPEWSLFDVFSFLRGELVKELHFLHFSGRKINELRTKND